MTVQTPFDPPVLPTRRRVVDSPVGSLTLAGTDVHLTHLLFGNRPVTGPGGEVPSDDRAFTEVATQLDEFFAGDRTAFDLRLAPSGTPFQLAVWAALTRIPYGTTWSYGELAAHIGRPTASRAVGAANGRNPISIIVPCHRVIGASGNLTGYGGGLDTKSFLLELERTHVQPRLPLDVA